MNKGNGFFKCEYPRDEEIQQKMWEAANLAEEVVKILRRRGSVLLNPAHHEKKKIGKYQHSFIAEIRRELTKRLEEPDLILGKMI